MTASLLRSLGHEVVGPAHSYAEAISCFEAERPDAALIDIGLPDRTGSDLIPVFEVRQVRSIVLSANARGSSDEVPGDVPWLRKPVDAVALQAVLMEGR